MIKNFIKKYRIQNFIILSLTFIMALIQTGSAVIHTFATDALIKGNLTNFIAWNMISLTMWGGLFVINYFSSAYEEKIIQLISTDIRNFITEKISASHYQNVTRYTDGTYTSWLNNDIKQIQDNGIRQYYAFWGYIFSVTLSIIALISYHYSLVLVTFLLMGILMKFPSLFENKMNKATENLAKANETFLSKIQDTISGYDVLFSVNNLKHMKKRICESSHDLADNNVKYVKSIKTAEGFIGIVNIFSQVGIVTFTGILAYLNLVTVGALSSTGSLASAIFNAISQGSQSKMMLKTSDVFFKKYDKFEKNNFLNSTEKNKKINNSIELKNINYSVNGKNIIRNANYLFEKGKKYAIIGDSGSGKSTLLNILAGKITNFNGEITVDGDSNITNNQLKNNIAYIPQNSYLFNDTVKNNISLWRDINDDTIADIHTKLKINEYASLNYEIKESGKNLSGGQKQRIAFARALTSSQSIYLLDESTANLDKETAINLENILLDDPNATVIMVTHRLFNENKNKFDKIIKIG